MLKHYPTLKTNKISPMNKTNTFLLVALLFLFLPNEGNAQERLRPYLNVGYVTNLQKCDECKQADTGGSIRVGILNKKKLGFYAGYTWFKEYHEDYIEYDDKGSLISAGIDLLLLRREGFEWYIKLGLGSEKFVSTYPGRTETETSIKPDFGLLFNFNFINTYVGWQPSDPPHINLGIGVTL
jgi:hypothetical protein